MTGKIFCILCALFVSDGILLGVQAKPAIDSSDPYMMPYYTGVIIPTPQKAEYKDTYISLTNTAIILNNIKQDDPRLKYLLERIIRYGGQYKIVKESAPEHSCIIRINDDDLKTPEKEQGYAIKSSEKTFSLKGDGFQGLLWAISSLNQMIFIKDGKPVIRSLDVTDWPDTKLRGMLGHAHGLGIKWYAHFMVAYKFNTVDFRGYIPGKAYHLLDKGRHGFDIFNKDEYCNSLKTAKELLTPLNFVWYAGCWELSGTAYEKKDGNLQLNCSSEEHFNFFYNNIYKAIAEAGGNISMQFDDQRFPLHPDDIKTFGSAAKADSYWITKNYTALRSINPDIKILFCPPFYWGPRSGDNYPEDREEYLKTIGKLPKAIDFYWTGPRVKGCKTKKSDAKWFANLTKRKPFVFQNGIGIPHIYQYHYGSDPVYNLKHWYYDGYLDDIHGYFLNGGDYRNSGVLVSIADWTWNRNSYNAETVIAEAIKKLMGPKAYPQVIKINKTLSFFDKYYSNPVSPNAMKNVAEIAAASKKLKEQFAILNNIYPSRKQDFWIYINQYTVMRFADKYLPIALKNPAVNKFLQDSEKTRAKAKTEVSLDSKKDIFRSAMEFFGGVGPKFYAYKSPKKGIDITRRLCTWIYGAHSIKPSMTTSFEITPFPPSGDYKLIISGLDDDVKNKCPIKISLNDHLIFEGPCPFSNKDWNIQEFKISADTLQRNNVLTIYNIADSDSSTGPPFFMLNYAVLRDMSKIKEKVSE